MEYTTIKREAMDEFVERRSRFIGYIKPVTTEEQAVAFIDSLRAKHWDATHNVYAYSLREGNACRYSDDGEPSGTAGTPVLSVLQKGGVTDAVVVVTRYFGGVLLGAGGLVRAYSHAASLAVAAGEQVVMRECLRCSVRCDYGAYGKVAALIPECAGVVEDSAFTDVVEVSFHIPEAQFGAFSVRLADATCGSCKAQVNDKAFFAVEHNSN